MAEFLSLRQSPMKIFQIYLSKWYIFQPREVYPVWPMVMYRNWVVTDGRIKILNKMSSINWKMQWIFEFALEVGQPPTKTSNFDCIFGQIQRFWAKLWLSHESTFTTFPGYKIVAVWRKTAKTGACEAFLTSQKPSTTLILWYISGRESGRGKGVGRMWGKTRTASLIYQIFVR